VHLHAEPGELALGAARQARMLVAETRQHRGARVDEMDSAAPNRRRPRGQGGGQLDAGEAAADDHEVGRLASRGGVLEEHEAGEQTPHVAGAAQREAVLRQPGHVLDRLPATRRHDQLVVAQRLDRAVAGGADADVRHDLLVAVDVRDHARDDGGPGHRVAEGGPRHRERQRPREDLTGEPVEAVVVVGADDDDLELSAPDLATAAAGQDLVCVECRVPPADEHHALADIHATASTDVTSGETTGEATRTGTPNDVGAATVKPRCA
jgi:hypothetical protein